MTLNDTKKHDAWCEQQHAEVQKAVGKIFTRLGTMETHIEAHATCAKEVREELKTLNSWTQKRDGATKALMWVAGISGTIIVVVTAVYKLSS